MVKCWRDKTFGEIALLVHLEEKTLMNLVCVPYSDNVDWQIYRQLFALPAIFTIAMIQLLQHM